VPGLVFGAVAIGYWALFGRKGGLLPLAPAWAPVFGMGPFALGTPLFTGFGAAPLRAAAIGGLSAVSVILASAATGGSPPYLDVSWELLARPAEAGPLADAASALGADLGPALAVAGWALAGLVMSLLSSRGTRGAAAAGLVVSVAVLIGTYRLWVLVDPTVTLDGGPVLNHVGGSLILVIAAIAAGPPARGGRPPDVTLREDARTRTR
jgi:hypothetical protein